MARVPLYFSHSYRKTDKELNEFFWHAFYGAGFSFTVDPVSTALQTTTLELMMARSPGFVAVVTYRQQEEIYQCSPFIVYEYGLAVQADKPRIILRDKRISPMHFDHRETIQVAFDEAARDRCLTELEPLLHRFHETTSALFAGRPYRLGTVGIALGMEASVPEGTDRVGARSRREIVEGVLKADGDRVVDLLEHADDPGELAQEVDGCDFAIVDLDDERASRVADFLLGRGTPMLKVARRGTNAVLPRRLRGGVALHRAAAADEMVTYWGDLNEFAVRVRNQVSRAAIDRTEFVDFGAGQRYFRSLGRTAAPVFVSNARSTNELARDLSKALRLENIPFFHYRYNNTIGLGRRWAAGLEKSISSSKIFMPIIDGAYWESQYCRHEYELAVRLADQGLITIVPGILPGHSNGPVVDYQGEDLRELAPAERVPHLVHQLDKLLSKEMPATEDLGADAVEPVEAGCFSVDVAILTILEEEYQAVYGLLQGVRRVHGTDVFDNLHAWAVGYIDAPETTRPYSVVLAMSGRAGTNAAVLVAKNTIQAFDPRAVLVVGVAGGLSGLSLGDVVVADRIIAYEYGKVDHGFHPRRDQDVPTDASLVSAAKALQARYPGWFTDLNIQGMAPGLTPRIVVGQVASGEKVIDDPTDAFFATVMASLPKLRAVEMEGAGVAAAIQDARESQRTVNFGMLRGISDLPRAGGSLPGTRASESGQTQMRDSWKVAASTTAAAAAVQLIRWGWPRPPRGLPRE